ncbi:MAG TPA: iron-containing alcohol dehydrogenase [bacterium]|nr:iron-containing alcohol dehydrogenase [bacterium]
MSARSTLHDEARPFRGPSRLWYGMGAAAHAADCARELGIPSGPVLVLTDPVVDKLGLADDVIASLREAGFALHRFSEIPGEPTVEVADRGAAIARELAPVLIVGVGGGSVMDVAKLAAALIGNPGSVLDYTHFGRKRFAGPSVPTILVPTTAGTGAEASQNAVVTSGSRKAFANNYPQLLAAGALLDPRLTVSLPPTVTAHTGLDALSHCVEGILSTNATALTDLSAVQGIGLIVRSLPRAYAAGTDAEARAGMVLAAYLGGLSLNAGMVLGHSIAYTIANRLHLPHGFSCALALPYAMAYSRETAAARLRRIGEAAGTDGADAVRAVESLCHDLGMPEALKTLGLARERLPEMVTECLEQYPRPNNPRPLDPSVLLSLYQAMWDGRPAHAWAS